MVPEHCSTGIGLALFCLSSPKNNEYYKFIRMGPGAFISGRYYFDNYKLLIYNLLYFI
jgi:hypothetical protein